MYIYGGKKSLKTETKRLHSHIDELRHYWFQVWQMMNYLFPYSITDRTRDPSNALLILLFQGMAFSPLCPLEHPGGGMGEYIDPLFVLSTEVLTEVWYKREGGIRTMQETRELQASISLSMYVGPRVISRKFELTLILQPCRITMNVSRFNIVPQQTHCGAFAGKHWELG